MSHNPNTRADTSGFNYPSAAGIPTPTATAQVNAVHPNTETDLGPAIDPNFGKLGGEHGGAGTRADDRKGEVIFNEGHSATPVAKHIDLSNPSRTT